MIYRFPAFVIGLEADSEKLIAHHCESVPVKYTFCNLSQPSKAERPTLVTFLPIVIFERLVQPRNAEEPILVTLFPIETLGRFEQLQNNDELILVRPFPSRICHIFLHPLQALLPMLVTLSGMIMVVSPVHL